METQHRRGLGGDWDRAFGDGHCWSSRCRYLIAVQVALLDIFLCRWWAGETKIIILVMTKAAGVDCVIPFIKTIKQMIIYPPDRLIGGSFDDRMISMFFRARVMQEVIDKCRG